MYRALGLAVVYIWGVWWCYEVIGRFRRDLEEIRELKQAARTGAIIFVWVLTAVVAVVLAVWTFAIIGRIVSFVRGF
jgi:uncharacterized membrane protein SpoIIM required for sporulation